MTERADDVPPTATGPLFDRLRREFLAGTLDRGLVTPEQLHVKPPNGVPTLADSERYAEAGAEVVRSGSFAAVILAGGMATRFGGVAKAAVELAPAWSLLRVKLAQVEGLARQLGTRIPVCVLVSRASKEAVEKILVDVVDENLLSVTTPCQTMVPRMRPTGEVFRDAAGQVSTAPPGHGEVLTVLREQVLPRPDHQGVGCFMVSNIDNVVADPELGVIGAQAARDVNLVEVTPAAPEDRGGLLVESDHGVEIIEDFRLDGAAVEVPKLLSTNTFYLAASTLRDGTPLPYYPVVKSVDGDEVVQFEQLLCDVGREHPLEAVRVEREGPGTRFIPLKTVEALDAERPRIVEILRSRGLDLS